MLVPRPLPLLSDSPPHGRPRSPGAVALLRLQSSAASVSPSAEQGYNDMPPSPVRLRESVG